MLRDIIEFMTAQPRDGTVSWYSHHVSNDEPYATDWCDVCIVGLEDKMNWAFTIIDATDPKAADPADFEIIVAPDICVHGLWDEEAHWYVDEIALPLDEKPPLKLRATPGYSSRYGWTTSRITQALEGWIHAEAGRLDLTVEWTPQAAPPQDEHHASDVCEEEFFTVFEDPDTGWEIQVPSNLMDELLGDIDVGALIIEQLKSVMLHAQTKDQRLQAQRDFQGALRKLIAPFLDVEDRSLGLEQAAFELNQHLFHPRGKKVTLSFDEEGEVISVVEDL